MADEIKADAIPVPDLQATVDALTAENSLLRTLRSDQEQWIQAMVDLAAKAPLATALEEKAKAKDAEAQALRDRAAAIDAATKK